MLFDGMIMVWFGMVWYGLSWFGMVWYDYSTYVCHMDYTWHGIMILSVHILCIIYLLIVFILYTVSILLFKWSCILHTHCFPFNFTGNEK